MRPTLTALVALATTFLAQGCCVGRCIDYEGGDSEAPPDVVVCGDESGFDVGYRIEGTVRDLGTGELLAYDAALGEAGLCIFAVDPTKALAGQDPDVVASSFVCEDGSFVLQGIDAKPTLGLFVAVDDGGKLGCDYAGDSSVMLTATGLGPELYTDLGDGDAILDIDALSLSADHVATLEADLAALGHVPETGLELDGFMAGYIQDASEAPVEGATISCASCDATYYWDDEPSDGSFGAGGTANTATLSSADAMFMVPGADITTYNIEDGGSHTWDPKLYGSISEYAVFIRLVAH